MIGRIFGLMLALMLAVLVLYVSRFWIFDFWGRDGLLGIQALRPQGDLLRSWLGGTIWRPMDIVLWAVGVFLLLSLVQSVVDRLKR